MSHQAEGDQAFITSFSPLSHHNKPEEHEESDKETEKVPATV